MSDLIRRSDAIEAVMAEGRNVHTSEYANAERIIHEADAVEALSMLPSAKALTSQDLAEPNKELKGSDLIRRQDAIKAIRITVAQYVPFLNGVNATLPMECEIALRSVPSAEPKTGKWELDPNGMDWNIPAWRCSECGFVANYIGVEANGLGNNPMNWAGSKFCPNCGARMKGADDEADNNQSE